MNWLLFFYNVILVAVGGWTIFGAYKLYRDFPRDYLQSYLYYLVAINVFGFIMYFLADLIVLFLLSGLSEAVQYHFYWLITLLEYPVLVTGIYSYIAMFTAMAEREFSLFFKRLYFGISALFVAFFALGFYNLVKSGDLKLLMVFYIYTLEWSVFSISLGLPLMVIIITRKKKKKNRDMISRFCLLYILGHTIYQISHQFLDYQVVIYIILPFLFFGMNVPPLLAIKKSLSKMKYPAFFTENSLESYRTFFLYHKISPRESEIAMLLFEGFTTKEIEDKLYISEKTIKNHTYNIYRKTGVSTRIQFFNKLLQVKRPTPTKE